MVQSLSAVHSTEMESSHQGNIPSTSLVSSSNAKVSLLGKTQSSSTNISDCWLYMRVAFPSHLPCWGLGTCDQVAKKGVSKSLQPKLYIATSRPPRASFPFVRGLLPLLGWWLLYQPQRWSWAKSLSPPWPICYTCTWARNQQEQQDQGQKVKKKTLGFG